MTTIEDALSGWRAWMLAAGRPDTTVNLRCYQLERVGQRQRSVDGDHRGPCTLDRRPQMGAGDQAVVAGGVDRVLSVGRRDRTGRPQPCRGSARGQGAQEEGEAAPERVIRAALVGADDRLWLMLNLAWRCGLRRGEIARTNGADLVEDQRGTVLVVHGKGGRERFVPVPADVVGRLRQVCRGNAGGWAFAGQIEGHLSARRVGEVVADALPGGWTCHTLRHRFGTSSYATSGGDLVAVQELLGHAKPETTRRRAGQPEA